MLVLEKKGTKFLKDSRFYGLFIPTLFSILIILPLINFIIYYYHSSLISFKSAIGFSHVWFIIILSVINLLIYFYPTAFYVCIRKISKLKFRYLILLILLLSSITFLIKYIIVFKFFPNYLSPVFVENKIRYEVTQIIYQLFMYFPLFVFGAVVYRKKIKFHGNLYLLMFSTIIYLSCFYFKVNYLSESILVFKIIFFLIQMCVTAFFVYNLVSVFYNLKVENTEKLMLISKSALPFYLCHMPFVYYFSYLIAPIPISNILSVVLVIFLTVIFTFLSCYLIMKSKYLRLAFGIRS